MGNKTDTRRTKARELLRDTHADEILEFVFNNEEEALFGENVVLNHQRDMPALQEYLQDMYELDSQPGIIRSH